MGKGSGTQTWAARGRWGARYAGVAPLLLVVGTCIAACGARTGLNIPKCGDPGITCVDVANTSSKIVYSCNIHLSGFAATVFGADHGGDIPVCLPSNLNRWTGSPTEVAAIDAMSPNDYDIAIANFGNQVVIQQFAALKAVDVSGSLCGAITDAAQNQFTSCQVKLGARDSFCEVAANFAPKFCVPNDCHNLLNPDGTINAHGCNCNTTVSNSDDCNLPGHTVVVPPPGTGDPPGDSSGILAHLLASANAISLDPTRSSAHAFVHFDDHLGFGHSDSSTAPISGVATLYGRQRPDGTSHLLFEMGGTSGDMAFHFSNVDVIGDVDVHVTGIKITGAMGDTGIDFDSLGNGIIPSAALNLIIEANVNGQRLFVTGTNGPSIVVHANFQAKTFDIPAFTTSVTGLDLTVAIAGTIVNQPPTANAGAPQTVECTSAAGSSVVLNGAASDPDGDRIDVSWSVDQAFGSTHIVSNELQPTVLVPFAPPSLTTPYVLSVNDARSEISRSDTTVTVQDTTPPTLSISVDPACLWAPNHAMVLYELGSTLAATSTDTCDLHPTIAISGVVSNQPPVGGGSGNTPFDVLFGKRAFCVRAERDGTVSSPREYTVAVMARDASGNQTVTSTFVRVAHDQNDPKCTKIDPARLVADTDPRCTAN